MTTKPTQADATPKSDPANDIVPDVIDDRDTDATVVASQDDGADDGQNPREPKAPAPIVDEGRQAIYARHRELRKEQVEAEQDADAGEGDGEANDQIDDQGADPAAQPDQGAQKAQDGAAPPRKIKLKVDGKDLELTEAEVVERAQKYIASDNRLEESKRILKEAQEAAARLSGQPKDPANQQGSEGTGETQDKPDPSPGDAPAANQRPKIDPAKLTELVERIQVGDRDEGAQALAEAMSLAMQEAGSAGGKPADVATAVRTQVVAMQREKEAVQVYDDWKGSNKDLVSSQFVMDGMRRAISTDLLTELQKTGLTEEQLKPLAGNVTALQKTYYNALDAGHQLPSLKTIMDRSTAVVRKEFNRPSPAPKNPNPQQQRNTQPANDPAQQQRVDRKRAAPSQPRTASGRQAAPAPSKPPTRAEAIEKMRAARGYAPRT